MIESKGRKGPDADADTLTYTAKDIGLKDGDLSMERIDPQLVCADRVHYQRPLEVKRLKSLLDRRSPERIGDHTGLLARHKNGTLWVIDGQHHTYAAVLDGDKTMSYWVFESSGRKQDKEVFEKLNKWHRKHGATKSLKPYVKAAFANGWAEAGDDAFPYPDDIAEVFELTLQFAEANHDSPLVLEAVRIDARRRGLWSALNHRRDGLALKWSRQARPILLRLAQAAMPSLVDRFRVTTEAVNPKPPTDPIIAQADGLFAGMADDPAMQDLLALIEQAHAEAVAEGRVQGQVYVSDLIGDPIPAMDHAFAAAMDPQTWPTGFSQLDALRSIDWSATSWIDKITHGLSYDLGNSLANAVADGMSPDDMLALVQDVIGPEDAASMMLDYMMGNAITDETLNVYSYNGVEWVILLIQPDACLECEGLQAEGPWLVDDAPDVPVHPRCRCSIAPRGSE